MNIAQLMDLADRLFYIDSSGYQNLISKQKEILSIIKPATNIKNIDYKKINKYVEYLKSKGNSPKTINDKLSYISTLLTYALQNQLIDSKPYIPYCKVIQNKEKYFTEKELIRCFNWTRINKQKELQKIILIGLYTGLRIHDILALTTDNIKNDSLYIYDSKVNRNYVIPISHKLKYVLKDYKKISMNYNRCHYLFNKMKKELKLDKRITIHTLRHTFCSRLIQKGIPIIVIQKLANHKSIKTTLRYAHLNTQQLKEAINIL